MGFIFSRKKTFLFSVPSGISFSVQNWNASPWHTGRMQAARCCSADSGTVLLSLSGKCLGQQALPQCWLFSPQSENWWILQKKSRKVLFSPRDWHKSHFGLMHSSDKWQLIPSEVTFLIQSRTEVVKYCSGWESSKELSPFLRGLGG